MTLQRIRQIWMRAVPAAALTLGLGSVALAGSGCSKDPPPLGGEASLTPSTTSGNYRLPLDSVPSSDGSTFYFTAMGQNGMGVFSVPAAGGQATELTSGGPLVSPFGIAISSDDKTLYIADAAAGYDPNDPAGADKIGLVLSLPTGGGVPSPIASTAGYKPRGIEVARMGDSDTIYFSGRSAVDDSPGVFSLGSDGSGLASVLAGGPLADPSGIAVARDGAIYVANALSPQDGTADIFALSGGAASLVVGGLRAGYPTGLAVSQDGKTLLLSGQDRDLGTSVVYRVDVATKTVAQTNVGIENNTDSGGLHRARSADMFSWCGVTAGAGGIVYRVEFK